MEQIITFSTQHTLTESDVKDILTTAIEGGIGYFLCLCNDEPDWIEARKNWKAKHNNEIPCYCDVAYELMSTGKSVKFEDQEDNDKPLYLTMGNLKKGCALFTEHTGRSIHKMLDESDFDAEDADMIIQYSLFGDVIYG